MFYQITLIALLLGIYGVLSPTFAVEKVAELQDEHSSSACPPGYWCKKKREFDSAACPRRFICKSKRSTEACPPGYWCRRSDLVDEKPTKPEECRDGFWCKEVESSQPRSMSSFRACPPGYWCRRKRSIDFLSKRSCPRDFTCDESQEEGSEACPPGYWCKKKRSIIHSATKENECRRGFWCKREAESS